MEKRTLWNATLAYVTALVVLATAAYITTDAASLTALIPAAYGAIVFAAYLTVQRSHNPRRIAVVALVVGVVGLIATAPGLGRTLAAATGATLERPAAAISQAIMAILSLLYAARAARVALPSRSPVTRA